MPTIRKPAIPRVIFKFLKKRNAFTRRNSAEIYRSEAGGVDYISAAIEPYKLSMPSRVAAALRFAAYFACFKTFRTADTV